jgi:hypothetical protein
MQLEAILAENNELRQKLAQLEPAMIEQQMTINQRSEPMLCAVIDALANTARAAQAGHPNAQAIIRAWDHAQAEAATAMQAIRSGLQVVRQGPPNGHTPE